MTTTPETTQTEATKPRPTAHDEIYELGKKEVCYDRQVAVLGKKSADSVLYFWMKGYEFALNIHD